MMISANPDLLAFGIWAEHLSADALVLPSMVLLMPFHQFVMVSIKG